MRSSIFNAVKIAVLVLIIIAIGTYVAEAQCPMCRMSAESNLKNGGTAAAGLNKGIVYLLSVPYILVSLVGYLWWRNRRMIQEQEQEQEIRSLLEPHDVVISQTSSFNEGAEA